jgi:dolichyl-phosphate beta-glucosyltransferase
VVVPAYNEEHRITHTLLKIGEFLKNKKIDAEVIVIDDGSTDKTSQVVKSQKSKIPNLTLITLEKNLGKGNAIKTGIMKASGELVLMIDADNSTPIDEYTKLRASLTDEYDIVIGSRYLKDSYVQIRQPFYRIAIGRLGNMLISMFLVKGIKDTQCGFKLFRNAAAKQIFSRQKIKRWGFDMEALVIAKLLHYKTKEVPVSWFNSVETRLRPIHDTFGTLMELIHIKINLLGNKYKI